MTNSTLCWADEQEKLFSKLQQTGGLTRIQAIQLYKRAKSNPDKARKIAQDNYAMTDEERAGYATRLNPLNCMDTVLAQFRGLQDSEQLDDAWDSLDEQESEARIV